MMRNYFKFFAYLFLIVGFSVSRAGAYEDFFRAVANDDPRTVQDLLGRGFDADSRDDKGQAGLYLAMREGSFKAAAVLLAHPQTRVDLPNAVGETAVMMAALKGHADWVGRLLDRGANPEGTATSERPAWTPLHYAASGPAPKAVALLLARGAKVDARSPNGSTPLMMAAGYGPEESLDLLLKSGADLRLRNGLGLGPSDFARQGGREALTRRLQDAEKR